MRQRGFLSVTQSGRTSGSNVDAGHAFNYGGPGCMKFPEAEVQVGRPGEKSKERNSPWQVLETKSASYSNTNPKTWQKLATCMLTVAPKLEMVGCGWCLQTGHPNRRFQSRYWNISAVIKPSLTMLGHLISSLIVQLLLQISHSLEWQLRTGVGIRQI